MKLFIDTANIQEIEKASQMGVLDGVTTNPTLLSKEKEKPEVQIRKICEIVDGPVSAEVISQDFEDIVKEAEELAKIAPNIVVKIPCTLAGLQATKRLASLGIKTNLTLCFSPSQAVLVAKAGASFVSPFVGRLDDISQQGMELVREIRMVYNNYNFSTKIIVASVRHPLHFLEAAKMGADIATVPFGVIEKLMRHPLTDIGIKRFLDDYKRLKEGLNR